MSKIMYMDEEYAGDNEAYFQTCPIGKIDMFAGVSAPSGWLLCDGSTISRSVYSELFEVIGTIYGDGDGETTFNLPDMRGRMPIGSDSTYELGDSGGSISVSYTPGGSIGNTKLTDAQMAHGHGFTQPTVNKGATTTGDAGTHQHMVPFAKCVSTGSNGLGVSSPGTNYNVLGAAGNHHHSVPDHTHTVSSGSVSNLSGASSTRTAHGHSWTGTQATLNTISPYRAINFIIYSGV